MKKMLLLLLVFILLLHENYAQQVVFVATVFRNTTTNPCTITVQLGLDNKINSCNSNSTSGAINVVDINFKFNWNPAILNLVDVTFIPSGGKLDDPSHFSGSPADNGTPFTNATNVQNKNYAYGTFRSFNFQRSTNYCNSTINVPCGMIVPLFMATFTMDCAVSNNYSFNYNANGNNDTYIVQFIPQNGVPTNDFKEILFEIDQTRSLSDMSGKCNSDGTIKNDNSLTNNTSGNYYTNTQGAILPVHINDFIVAQQGQYNLLHWTTQTELFNKGFEIQKKVNDEFKTIAFVFSKAEGGNSNIPLAYSYKDMGALPGQTIYYRLKMISDLGMASYSEVRSVKRLQSPQVKVFPNPSVGWLNIILPEESMQYDIQIVDYMGRMVRAFHNIRQPFLHVADLPRGFYQVLVTHRQTGNRSVEKLIVQ